MTAMDERFLHTFEALGFLSNLYCTIYMCYHSKPPPLGHFSLDLKMGRFAIREMSSIICIVS